jgi:hypothetical protein
VLLVLLADLVRPLRDVVEEEADRGDRDGGKATGLERSLPGLDQGTDLGILRQTRIQSRLVVMCSTYITCVPPTPGGS